MSDLDRYLTVEAVEKAARAIYESERMATPWRDAPGEDQSWFTGQSRAALSAVLPDMIRRAKAEAWDEGAQTAWDRSTPEVNGRRYHWRHEGEPTNPYRKETDDD